jgi:hypothetical protein
MDYTKTNLGEIATEAAKRLDCDVDDLVLYSWPQSFGDTSGPHHKLAGQMMTSFQVYAFRSESRPDCVRYCSGLWKSWNGKPFEPWR